MRRLWTLLVVLTLLPVGIATTATSSSAASSLSIGKIASATAPYRSKVKVKPRVTKLSTTKVVSSLLTVKQGRRTVAKKVASVRLAAGTYKVTTTVRYRTSHVQKTTAKVNQRVVGVSAYEDTRVSCTATRVEDLGATASLDATCTGSAFDGSLTLLNLDASGDGTGETWAFDDDFDLLTFAALPVVGATFQATLTPADDLYRTQLVTRTTTKTIWSGVKTVSRTQTLHVKAGKKPNHTTPDAYGECPAWAPVKGNANSGIYHVPGGRWYKVTVAEECFTTAAAARAHGYRASRNG